MADKTPEETFVRLENVVLSSRRLTHDDELALCHAAATIQDSLRESLAEARAQVAALRNVCAEAYQFAGAVGAPVAVLDNLSDAAQGQALRHETFLPVLPEDCAEVAALTAERDAAKAELAAAKQERDAFGAAVDAVNALTPLASRIGPLHGAGIADGFRLAKDAMRAAMLAARAPEGTEGKDKDGEA